MIKRLFVCYPSGLSFIYVFVKYGVMSVAQGIILKAWIDLTSGKDAYAKKAGKYFDEGLKERADIFALMGKVRWETHMHIKLYVMTANEDLGVVFRLWLWCYHFV